MPDIFDPGVQLRAEMLTLAGEFASRNTRLHEMAVRRIFKNSKLKPAEALAALGTDAARLAQTLKVCRDAVNAVTPGEIDDSMLPALTINEDGTVVLTVPPG